MSPQNTPQITPEECVRLDWCLKEYGQLNYVPTFAGNTLFLALFTLALLTQIGLAIRHKTWGYLGAMVGGLALEIIGYAARLELHNDIFDRNYFIIYLVGLTIGPAFFSAAVYLSTSRIITIFGSTLSFFRPKTITAVFICSDLLSLVLQAAGGAIASEADTPQSSQSGVNIMIAGLSTQVASTTTFCLLCLQLAWAIRRHPEKLDDTYESFRRTMRFRLYLLAIATAAITILIRCCFRVAELRGGFHGSLANNETDFMVLDGAMMIICSYALTAAHPGTMLGSLWALGAFHWRSKSTPTQGEKRDVSSSKEGSETGRDESFGQTVSTT